MDARARAGLVAAVVVMLSWGCAAATRSMPGDPDPAVSLSPVVRDPKGYVEPEPEPERKPEPESLAPSLADRVDSDGDGIADVADACPDLPESHDGWEDEDGCPDDVGCTLPGNPIVAVDLSFERGAEIPESGRDMLLEFAQALMAQGATRVQIEGHTDNRGSAEANERLARRRAKAVRTVLIEGGLAPEILEVVVHGHARPVADNLTAEGRRHNRRVSILCVEGC